MVETAGSVVFTALIWKQGPSQKSRPICRWRVGCLSWQKSCIILHMVWIRGILAGVAESFA